MMGMWRRKDGQYCRFLNRKNVWIQGAVEDNKENTPDQKSSSRKRDSLSGQQEMEERPQAAKKTCL